MLVPSLHLHPREVSGETGLGLVGHL
jgi:hypothetical protein